MPKILWTFSLDGPLLQCNCPLRVQKSRARDAINLTRRSLTWIGAFPAPINGVNSGRAGNKHSDHSRKNYLSIVIHLNEMQHLKQSASLICFEFTYICYKSVSTLGLAPWRTSPSHFSGQLAIFDPAVNLYRDRLEKEIENL